MRGIVDRWIPPSILAEPDQARRARIIVGTALLIGLSAFVGPSIRHALKPLDPVSISVYATLTFVWLGLPFVVRRWGRLDLASHVLAGSSIAMLMFASWLNGGIRAPIVLAFIIVPMFTGLTSGFRASVVIGVMAMVVIGGLLVLDLSGHPRPVPFASDTGLWIVHTTTYMLMIGCAVAIVGVYERERLRKEALLRASERRYRQAIASASNVAYAWSPGKPLFCSPALLDWLSADEAPADLESCVAADDRPRLAGALRACIEHGEPLHGEYRLRSGERWVEIHGEAQPPSGQRGVGISGLLRDISREKELEAMKEDFSAFVVHELRSPVAAVKGSLRLLEVGLVTEPAKRRDMLAIALRGCDRLSSLVDDLLDMQKLERDKMQYDRQPLDLARLARATVEEHEGLASHYGVTFELGGLESVVVEGDERWLAQVLVNLLSNAAKHTPGGGTVTVRVVRQPERARLEVVDQGPGVPEVFRASLFDKFSQARSEEGRRSGTGLGLSLAKLVVDDHQGTIDVENLEGGGARFFVELPRSALPLPDAARGAAADRSASPEASSALSFGAPYAGHQALIVDDREANRVVARELLASLGFEVVLAHGGKEGVEAVRQHPGLSVVFMDVRMPDIDGYEATQLIRSGLGARSLPIVATTASVTRDNASRCMAAGMNDYLAKPIEYEELRRVLSRWVQSEGEASPVATSKVGVPSETGVGEAEQASSGSSPADLSRATLEAILRAAKVGDIGAIRSLLGDAPSAGGDPLRVELWRLAARFEGRRIKQRLERLLGE